MDREALMQQIQYVAETVGKRHHNAVFDFVRDGVRSRLQGIPWWRRQYALIITRPQMKYAAKQLGPALAYCAMADASGQADDIKASREMLDAALGQLRVQPSALKALRDLIAEEVFDLGGHVLAKQYAAMA